MGKKQQRTRVSGKKAKATSSTLGKRKGTGFKRSGDRRAKNAKLDALDENDEMEIDTAPSAKDLVKRASLAKSPGALSKTRSQADNLSSFVSDPPKKPATNNAYIAAVPTIGKGKDKTPLDVAKQYEKEAFDDTKDLRRLGMVVGLNALRDINQSAQDQIQALTTQASQASNYQGFRLGVVHALWEPRWRFETLDEKKKNKKKKTTNKSFTVDKLRDHIRDEAGVGNETAANQALQTLSETTQKQALKAGVVPVGQVRDMAMHSAAFQTIHADFKQRFSSVQLHAADADAVSLHVPTTPKDEKKGLLDRYDKALTTQRQNEHPPTLLTGGYQFQHGDARDDSRLASHQQTVDTAAYDMTARQGMASVHGGAAYVPEPNFIFDITNLKKDMKKLTFGKANQESDRFIESATALANNKATSDLKKGEAADWAKTNVAFDLDAALITDAGRFDHQYDKKTKPPRVTPGPDLVSTVRKLSNQKRASQSHARKKAFVGRLDALYGRMTSCSGFFDILSAMLPHELLSIGSKEALEDARDTLDQFANITEGIVGLVNKHLELIQTTAGALKKGGLGTYNAKSWRKARGLCEDMHKEIDPGIQKLVKTCNLNKSHADKLHTLFEGCANLMLGRESKGKTAFKGMTMVQVQEALAIIKQAADEMATFLVDYEPTA